MAPPRKFRRIATEEAFSVLEVAEGLRTVSRAGSDQTIWWYRSMLEILTSRSDWPQREMMSELRMLSADLVRSLRQREVDL